MENHKFFIDTNRYIIHFYIFYGPIFQSYVSLPELKWVVDGDMMRAQCGYIGDVVGMVSFAIMGTLWTYMLFGGSL